MLTVWPNRVNTKMNIALLRSAPTSAVSGQSFTDGDRIESLLFFDPEDGILRLDRLVDEAVPEEVSNVLGKWRWVWKSEGDSSESNSNLPSPEELFLTLNGPPEATEEPMDSSLKGTLNMLLALYLARKRILRAITANRYRHVSSGNEYTVETVLVNPEVLNQLEDQLNVLLR